MKMLIRYLLSTLLLYGVFTETGIWTTIFATLVLLNLQVIGMVFSELTKFIVFVPAKNKEEK